MAGIDSLLKMLDGNGGDVLRVATDAVPKMSKMGSPLRLSMPATTDATLRHLLGPLLSPEREAELRTHQRLELLYTPESGGAPFSVVMQALSSPANALDVTFRRAPAGGAKPALAAVRDVPPREVVAPMAAVAPPLPSPAPVERSEVARQGPDPHLVSLLAQAVERRASDVHLHAGETPTMRVDGRLMKFEGASIAEPEELLSSLLAGAGRAALDSGRSADLAFDAPGLGRFRVNAYRTRGVLAAAIRVLPLRSPTLEELHFPVPLGEIVDVPHGLVLVTGPTGSGKSATLAALARRAIRRQALLISLEDPIEYPLDAEPGAGLVRQRQVGSDVRDFPTGLRDALREDPNVLLIGEMRDPETISLALTAAETGHLVLASLHSRSASSSVERIVDSYPPERQQQIRVQLADALSAIISQRLLPRAEGSGRLPAIEVLRGNHTISSLIREGKTAQIASAIQSGRKDGMLALERCLADLVRGGQVKAEDAAGMANEPAAFMAYLKS